MISANTKINIIIGDPVAHSLSPQMHNSAYKALGIDSEFVYVGALVKPEDLEQAIKGFKAININGITVTIPHKENIIKFLDEIEETALTIGAVNTIVNKNGKFVGANTDWIGVVEPIEQIIKLKDKNVVVIGAGGFAHAAVFACVTKGAQVTVLNRTQEKAKRLAEKFNCSFASFSDETILKNADIIINATSVGMENYTAVIPSDAIHKNQIVFDAVYVPYETALLKEATEKGATVIHGTELLLHQGIAQFELFTGKKAPIDAMKKILMENIKL